MKVTRNWLKRYVDFDWTADQLAERLTMLGLEVEGVEHRAGEFEGIVVAQVITRDQHPNADKLSICRVHDGQGERQIVCGAANFQPGDKVPLILPGASLPAQPGAPPFPIKVGKIRGVESHGMMCSPKELGLAEDAAGLLILPSDAQIGQPFAEHLGRSGSDVVFDLEITPNRPDLNSVLGIAREIAATTGNPLRVPDLPPLTGETVSDAAAPSATDLVSVRLEDRTLCPRYTARVIRGVKVGPSPDWLRSTLEQVGLRSINNVVDVTNFVMLECGQPLHAFDYHLVARPGGGRPTIVVRRARDGEVFVTLDGQKHTLTRENLLIADDEKGIALAGVMGGLNSEIRTDTRDVLLESAYFLPTNIRHTSKRLGLRTDASYRFERGADLGATEWASRRCAQLILETAGGQLAGGVVDAYPEPVEPHHITLRHHKVNELLGIELDPAEIEYHLGQLGLKLVGRKPQPVAAPARPEPARFRVPSWRVDLKGEADLIEEVCRLHGVEKIPPTPPRGLVGAHAYDAVHDQLAEARQLLTGLGLHEAQGQTLVSGAALTAFLREPNTGEAGAASVASAATIEPPNAASVPAPASSGASATGFVRLANPLSADMDALRPSLLPGLLEALRHNVSRKSEDVALFEVGRVFGPADEVPVEQRRLAIALTGRRNPAFWSGAEREAKLDMFDLKGLIEEFLDGFGLRGLSLVPRAQPTPLFIESATVTLGGRVLLGELGQVQPLVARQYDLRDAVWLAELNLDQLLARRTAVRAFRTLPAYPAIRRDLAMLVPDATTHEAVLAVVKQARAPYLEHVELFDVFRGRNVPPGQKSLAYAFTYRGADRTLTDPEVNAAHERLVELLKARLNATVREG